MDELVNSNPPQFESHVAAPPSTPLHNPTGLGSSENIAQNNKATAVAEMLSMPMTDDTGVNDEPVDGGQYASDEIKVAADPFDPPPGNAAAAVGAAGRMSVQQPPPVIELSGQSLPYNIGRKLGGTGTLPVYEFRVADPVPFWPDPTNQNFENRIRILLALMKKLFKHLNFVRIFSDIFMLIFFT